MFQKGDFIMFPVKNYQNLKCFQYLCNSTDLWPIYSRFDKIIFEVIALTRKGKYLRVITPETRLFANILEKLFREKMTDKIHNIFSTQSLSMLL